MANLYGSLYALDNGFKTGLFKIYVTEGALYGAKVAGGVYDEASARPITAQFGLLGFLIAKPIGKRAAAKREAKEREYDAIAPDGPEFAGKDKANFVQSATGLQNVTVSSKVGWLSKSSNAYGVLEWHDTNGKKRKFLLMASPDAPNVYGAQALLNRAIPTVKLES